LTWFARALQRGADAHVEVIVGATRATRAGSEYLNLTPNMSASEFIDNLAANGFSRSMAGTTTLMRNGAQLYSVYVRKTTSEFGAQYLFSNPSGANGAYIGIKFLLNGP
jgi:hypothetical protein